MCAKLVLNRRKLHKVHFLQSTAKCSPALVSLTGMLLPRAFFVPRTLFAGMSLQRQVEKHGILGTALTRNLHTQSLINVLCSVALESIDRIGQWYVCLVSLTPTDCLCRSLSNHNTDDDMLSNLGLVTAALTILNHLGDGDQRVRFDIETSLPDEVYSFLALAAKDVATCKARKNVPAGDASTVASIYGLM